MFLIDNGVRYEMAPAAWSGVVSPDANASYCDNFPSPDIPAAAGTAIGTGAANTAAIFAAGYSSGDCSSSAAAAVLSYPGTDSNAGQWFLPSVDELNAMYGYSITSGFNSTVYGFASAGYWSSSQSDDVYAWLQSFSDGYVRLDVKVQALRVRPIRTF